MSTVSVSSADVATNRTFAAAVVVGFVNALWALFQWAELLLARQGGTPFCSLNETVNCAAVWDSAVAVAVHDVTQIPVAGWGLIWGITATLLPLPALVDRGMLARGVSAALRLTAIAGLASIVGLGAASFAAGALCLGCLGTYALVAVWSALAWSSSKDAGFAEPGRGAAMAGLVVAVSFAVLVVPGTRTPHAPKKLSLPPASAGASPSSTSPASSMAAAPSPSPSTTATAKTTDMFDGPPTGDPVRDDLLNRFMAELEPEARQVMSDLLRDYRATPVGPVPPTRALVSGSAKAPLKIVDWTDPLCPHCALLHETLKEIEKSLPPGLFSVEARHFPLDGFCNSAVQRKSPDGTRCVGAKAQICMEGDPKAFEAAGALFAARAETVDGVYAAFAPYRSRALLEKCVNAPETNAKLQADIAAAEARHLQGTPLLLMNGREVPPFGPLVYVLILTGGADRHPAFKGLPEPRAPKADAHAGHGH